MYDTLGSPFTSTLALPKKEISLSKQKMIKQQISDTLGSPFTKQKKYHIQDKRW